MGRVEEMMLEGERFFEKEMIKEGEAFVTPLSDVSGIGPEREKKLKKAGILYIDVLYFQSFAGVMASFAGLGSVVVAEPGTRIGFTGERGRSSIKQELPAGFQTAEFMIERGMIDMIVERKNMKTVLADLQQQMEGGPTRRLTIDWRIDEEETRQ